MNVGRLNHIGIATPDIAATRDAYAALYGLEKATEIKEFPKLGVKVCFIDTGNTELELLEPLGAESPVNRFLEKNPKGGQHHLCFEVPDIIAARDAMRGKGATVLGTGEPYIGAHGVPVIFVHPKDTHGVLIELMQEPA
ncbi:methylmalonyl-CoA epimerase [Hyphobacterium sp.]|jgi:methylmalonyl-CoA/ethylmalonyl-CoA epimerase|uniref:methylmalonyl-CoA epimerase n=1 Tax=Hyphobacterium sp. TaxID=2004662 RepID=UPI003BAC5920